jgi:hypothetical protein
MATQTAPRYQDLNIAKQTPIIAILVKGGTHAFVGLAAGEAESPLA